MSEKNYYPENCDYFCCCVPVYEDNVDGRKATYLCQLNYIYWFDKTTFAIFNWNLQFIFNEVHYMGKSEDLTLLL